MRLFLGAFFAGFVLTLLAAHFYPLPAPVRAYSLAAALPNGGREEVFTIRLPDDKLGSPRAAAAADFPVRRFAADGRQQVLAELFRVRDINGKLIGLAARLNGTAPDFTEAAQAVTDWMLLLPGRGALLMSRGSVAAGGEYEFVAERMGFSVADSGSVVGGSGDFAGLAGFYQESTAVDRVAPDGEVFGQVTLTTRLRTAL